MSSFVDPTSLSLPSPSPSPASPSADHPHPTPEAGPSRKRARTEVSSEERKEARAHRNRIAAQNSRDRRKAQFSYLERRVQELEEENRQLRASMGLLTPTSASTTAVQSHVILTSKKTENEERSLKQQRENEELRERIKTLEKGWEAVLSALQTQGISAGVIPLSSSQPSSVSTTTPVSLPSSTATTSTSTPSKPASEPTTLNNLTAFPSPAPSHSSLDFDLDTLISGPNSPTSLLNTGAPSPVFTASSVTSTASLTPVLSPPVPAPESTRHLARVATIDTLSMPQQRVDSMRSLDSTPLVSLSINTFPRYTTALAQFKAAGLMQTKTRQWKISSARSSSRRLLRRPLPQRTCPSKRVLPRRK